MGRTIRRTVLGIAAAIIVYVLAAYLLLPAFWTLYSYNGELRDEPMRTVTAQGILGDPINVGLVGADTELIAAMAAAGWQPADPITFRSSLRIAASVIFNRPDANAPVSGLYYDGRRQDFAFEKQAARSAAQRHHVRFWRILDGTEDTDGRPLWLGSATFDRDVGVSRYTAQVTHHIAPNVDDERNELMADLAEAGWLTDEDVVLGIGPTLNGRNGGGDPFYTDGLVSIGELKAASD